MLWWSGLRGAIAFALSLQAVQDLPGAIDHAAECDTHMGVQSEKLPVETRCSSGMLATVHFLVHMMLSAQACAG